MTFDEITADAQTMIKDTSSSAKAVIQKGINKGLIRLRKKLRRKYAITTRQFTFEANQSVYQMPENAVRMHRLYHIKDGVRNPLDRIDNEDEWDALVSQTAESGQPRAFRVRSKDLYEVYPAPDSDDTGEIKYQYRPKQLKAADTGAGTVAVENGSQNVVGSGTAFTASMVGRSIKLDSAETSDKSDYYRIINVQDATHLTIENYYDGEDETGKSYTIGEVPDLPEEYHPALSDYGVYYFYLWRKDKAMADEFHANFLQAVADIDDEYSSDVVSNVIPSRRHGRANMIPNYRQTPKAISE